jgi:hypothetical protein
LLNVVLAVAVVAGVLSLLWWCCGGTTPDSYSTQSLDVAKRKRRPDDPAARNLAA